MKSCVFVNVYCYSINVHNFTAHGCCFIYPQGYNNSKGVTLEASFTPDSQFVMIGKFRSPSLVIASLLKINSCILSSKKQVSQPPLIRCTKSFLSRIYRENKYSVVECSTLEIISTLKQKKLLCLLV